VRDCQHITVGPHTITRRTKGRYDRFNHERLDDRSFAEVDVVFPFLARCGAVSAIGKTAEGAVGMVEKILSTKKQT
jgi:hypothetical protein